ncbi:hypothetical protein [Sphingopyxis sp. NFH-91]|nr:hypothetical protein [Sphingopyxis sp. NFH-91]
MEMLREEGRSFAKRRRTDARLDRMVETRARANDRAVGPPPAAGRAAHAT